MSMIFILIQIKFNIGMSDDELLETIWEPFFLWLSPVVRNHLKPKYAIAQGRQNEYIVRWVVQKWP